MLVVDFIFIKKGLMIITDSVSIITLSRVIVYSKDEK